MSVIALKCPECGANLEFDDSREFGFCQFCGTKILIESSKVINDNSTTINNYYSNSNPSPRELKCEIVRDKRFSDSMYKFYVYIDGFEVAKLKSGAVQPIELDEGMHEIVIRTHGFTDYVTNVKITSDTRLITGFDGTLKRRIFLRSERLR